MEEEKRGPSRPFGMTEKAKQREKEKRKSEQQERREVPHVRSGGQKKQSKEKKRTEKARQRKEEKRREKAKQREEEKRGSSLRRGTLALQPGRRVHAARGEKKLKGRNR